MNRPDRRWLSALGALVLSVLAPRASEAQGRCIRAYGTPACNTDSIPAVFARTGWRTASLDHITFRVADAKKEAAFYAALMDWKVRSETAQRVVMDVGDWGTVILRQVPADSFPAPAPRPGGRERPPVHAVVEAMAFDIEPWNAKAVEAELRKRGLDPVADNDGKGFESFHVKDRDGFDLQLGNGRGYTKARRESHANAKLSVALPFEPTGWQTVWLDHLSFGAKNYKASASFYVNLLGWGPTYDEGSQNELMIGDVGDIIVRGGNPLDPNFGTTSGRAGGVIDHISFGISPWDTDSVKAALDSRGLPSRIDTSDGTEIHVAQYKSYHTTTPNGYDLQISYNTHDTRLNLAVAVKPQTLEPGQVPTAWYAGGADCTGRPPLRVQAYNANLYIMRQAACTSYEKPFLYLLFGHDKALLFDTGAGRIDVAATVDTLIKAWLARNGQPSIDLVVAHSHAHGDHVAGDSQFVGRPRTTVVGRDSASVRAFFGVPRWPNELGAIDLGARVLDVIPIPGHQPASIAVYDRRTGILLTGDTFYPGRLYVRDTTAFAESIDRLAAFVRTHTVTHMLGAHVENSRTPFVDYVVGTVDQPDEHALDLGRAQLFELDSVVRTMRGRMTRTVLRDLTVWPVER